MTDHGRTDSEKIEFLEQDLFDALRWLLIAAVTWSASPANAVPHLRVLALNTVCVQARALYEFFFSANDSADDARAAHFAPSWTAHPPADLETYLGPRKPANKRIFHLVYGRSAHPGGTAADESDHLKNQVLSVAQALVTVTRSFVGSTAPQFRPPAQEALNQALLEARDLASIYGVAVSF